MRSFKFEKKCHACIGVWWQVVEKTKKGGKKIVLKSKRKKNCVDFVSQMNNNISISLISIFLLISVIVNGQFSLVEDFDSFGGVGEWTIDNGGGVQNYGGAENYLSFNLGSNPYLNSSTITATSPVYDLSTIIGGATVNFPISGIVEDGWDYMYFDYFDGGVWVSDTLLTGVQITTIIRTEIPNTATQFRFRLVTDPSFIIWYRNNGSWWWFNTAGFNTPVDISNSYVTGANPIRTSVYYYDISQLTIKGSTSALPIELISFGCELIDDSILLEWVTATEINNDYFVIEHSIDGFSWNILQELQGAGNSNETLSYSFMHYFPYNKINYYRLKQIDFDGNSEVFQAEVCYKEMEAEEIEEILYYNIVGQIVDDNYRGIVIEQIHYSNDIKYNTTIKTY